MDKKTALTTGAVVVVLALIVWGAVAYNKSKDTPNGSLTVNQENDYLSAPAGVNETPEEATTTPNSGTAAKRLTYSEAMQLYGSVNHNVRFQFINCSGTPGWFTLKKGEKYMLDNRDNARHTIMVGGVKYTLGAYGFAIATATQVGTQNVTCDGKGAAQLLIQ